MNRDKFILALLIIIFIFIRSINFTQHLNFSYDQAWFSTRNLEIWKNKEFTLVGPGSSIVVNGKQILYGSINYYYQLIFQLLGDFDPVYSSYAFMLFTGVMIIPLYYGVKMLADNKAAALIAVIYSLAPTYIDFTRFFFAPNFQLSLLPLLILSMGFYKKTEKGIFLFLIFFQIGVLFQFHFAVLLLFILLAIYYFKNKPLRTFKNILHALSGFCLGLLPLVIFELKNDFYNIRVFIDYLQNAKSVSNFEPLPHRYLVLSFTIITLLIMKFRNFINKKIIFLSCAFLLIMDLIIYLPIPNSGFGMSKNWNYPQEKKAYQIIREQNLKNYNLANLIYDNKAVVIKYLMKKDGLNIDFDDYYRNKFIFVIAKNEKEVNQNPAYEINSFKPRKKLKQWQLSPFYNLYLYERISS